MRKFFSFVMMLLVVSFSSCSKVENDAAEVSNESVPEQKESTVFRVFQADEQTFTQYSVLLKDKTVLQRKKAVYREVPSEFFFLKEGDTVVYSGDEVIEIRFKGE